MKRSPVPPMWPMDDGSYRIVVRRRGKKGAENIMRLAKRKRKKK
jgi:hypothetical protein